MLLPMTPSRPSNDPLPLWARKSTPGTLGASGDEEPDLEAFLRESSGRRLRCRVCGALVTSDGNRIEVEGRHVHRRINPAGFEFEFGCFGAARGAAAAGEPTTEFSWFAGYSWVYSLCRRCGAHLGWFFEGRDPRFHGLILNRLEVEDESPEAP